MKRLRPPGRVRTAGAALALCAVPVAVAGVLAAPAQANTGASSLAVSPRGSVLVAARGNGHGHGMSQYGARGAAQHGLSYPQILSFYYRGAQLVRTRPTMIRVRLSGVGPATAVESVPGLHVSGVSGPLSTTPRRFRLVSGAGQTLTLQCMARGQHQRWRVCRRGLPDHSAFHTTSGRSMRLIEPGGASTYYFGWLRANRTGNRVYTVNRVDLDRYTAGVVPREMPASWERAAVNAQAVAARTYGLYAVRHPRNQRYDICDTTSCQVYGGHKHITASKRLVSEDFPRAAIDTSRRVLQYGGEPIFAQFSASNGGWEIDGGQPYLGTRRDPYDTARAGDPYAYYTRTVRVQSLASWFGFGRLTRISVTGRVRAVGRSRRRRRAQRHGHARQGEAGEYGRLPALVRPRVGHDLVQPHQRGVSGRGAPSRRVTDPADGASCRSR